MRADLIEQLIHNFLLEAEICTLEPIKRIRQIEKASPGSTLGQTRDGQTRGKPRTVHSNTGENRTARVFAFIGYRLRPVKYRSQPTRTPNPRTIITMCTCTPLSLQPSMLFLRRGN